MDIGSYTCPEVGCGEVIEGDRVVDESLGVRIAMHKGRHEMRRWVEEQNALHYGLQVYTMDDGTYLVVEAGTYKLLAHTTSVEALRAVVDLFRKEQ